mgnify:CR=1 FL=1
MSLGPWEILILVALALLVFGGRGKISQIMGDFGKGLRNFKQNIKDENKGEKPLDVGEIEPKTIDTTATEILEEESKKVKVFYRKQINMLNTIGSIAPMIGLLGTVTGMIGAFNVLTESGMGGESSKQMAGNIGSALWTTASGLVVAIPTLIAYFIYKTKFGTIVAEVNRVAGEMVFTLVRAARGGFEEGEDQEEEYYEEEAVAAPEGLPEEMPPPAQ